MAFWPRKLANFWVFLALFSLCYLLETINFTLLITVSQSIEKQFEIPSRVSGGLVSTSDIGYILTVVLLAYVGSKRNRARWIGAGCMLIAVACLLVSLPHFIFGPSTKSEVTDSHRMRYITPDDVTLFVTKFSKPDPRAGDLFGGKAEGNASADSGAVLNLGNLDDEVKKATLSPEMQDYIDNWLREQEEERIKQGGSSTTTTTTTTTTRTTTTTKTPVKVPITSRYDASIIISDKDKKMRLKRATSLPMFICNPLVQKMKIAVDEDRCAARQPKTAAMALLFIGLAFIGVGHSMPWTLGMPMIDDHVDKRNTSLYFGGVFFIRIIGPVLGFVLGGICNLLYFSLQEPPPGITSLDHNWIGAWWLGYLVIFALLLIPSTLLFFFPTHHLKKFSSAGIPDAECETTDNVLAIENRAAAEKTSKENNGVQAKFIPKESNAKRSKCKPSPQSFAREAKKFWRSVLLVIKQPVYTVALFGRLFDAFAFKGFFTFFPKYLNVEFGMSKSETSFVLAGTGVIGFACGVAVGSYVTKRFKIEGRRAATLIMISSLCSALIAFSQMGISCQSLYTSASNIRTELGGNLTNECNNDCRCANATAYPVCSKNGTMYYSPCHAGCTNATLVDKLKFKLHFFECRCTDVGNEADRDWCPTDCESKKIFYFCLSVLSGFISGCSVIPGVLVMIRSVPVDLRSVALGFSAFTVSLLSTFPSPIVFGAIVDKACSKWSIVCGEEGSCELYDEAKLRYRMHGFMGCLRAISLLFDFGVIYFAKGLKLFEEHPGGEAVIRSRRSSHVNGHDLDETTDQKTISFQLDGSTNTKSA